MRFSFISAAVLAFISSAIAQTAGFDAITSPTQDQNIPAGSSFDIIWQPGTVTGTITITLLQGATPSTLVAGPVVASRIQNSLGKFTWTVPSSSSFATYGFMIVLDSTASAATKTLQYSFPFHITGGTSSSSGSASATGPTSTVTMHLSTGPSYTSSVSSTSSTSISSTTVISTSKNITTSATVTPTPSSNLTLSTLKTTSTKTSSPSSSSSSSSSGAPTATKNAAVSNIATGGLAMVGGILLAFAL